MGSSCPCALRVVSPYSKWTIAKPLWEDPMDSRRFGAITRAFSTRRAALAGLLGGMAILLGRAEAGAHNPIDDCERLPDPERRRACRRRARQHVRRRHTCRPRPAAVTCAGGCGRRLDNCRQTVDCTCPTGKSCLTNLSCNRPCPALTPTSCPTGCTCGVLHVESGMFHCAQSGFSSCTQLPLGCTSTADCPTGHFCGATSCPAPIGPNRCIPVCPH